MKILELRFKNLNSLYGEWKIDFSAPEYLVNGLFALTGPTGAGKSTVLDAICLALYGATPRLGKITKSDNEIMSRQTGECYAEILFQSKAGKFRSHWEQRRARKSANGKLQDPEHQISFADSGELIETKRSRIAPIIEEKTGLDFDRFTRSILLAQGGFDTFLKADIEHKSKILEQITGTEIYSEISQRVHERKGNEAELLNNLLKEISNIPFLSEEEEHELRLELDKKKQEEADLEKKDKEISQSISWLKNIEELKQELRSLDEDALTLENNLELFKPERHKLKQALKAASIEASYAKLNTFRKEQLEDENILKQKKIELPKIKLSAEREDKLLKSSEEKTVEAKEMLKKTLPVIKKVRSLDQTISDHQKTISTSETNCIKDEKKIESDEQRRAQEEKRVLETEKTYTDIKYYLKEHSADEWLVGGLAGIEEQFSNLQSKEKELRQKELNIRNQKQELTKITEKAKQAVNKSENSRKILEKAVKESEKSKKELAELLNERALREYRSEKEHLKEKQGYLKQIAALKTQRKDLEDGQPCPLCGSKSHPFAVGNIPKPDEIDQKIESLTKLITKAENFETANKKLEDKERVARTNLMNSEKEETIAFSSKNSTEKSLKELNADLENLKAGFNEQKKTILLKLKNLGIRETLENQLLSILDSLKNRLRKWKKYVDKKAEIEKEIAEIKSSIKTLSLLIENNKESLAEKQNDLNRLKQECFTLISERKELYDEKMPDYEETLLNKTVNSAEATEKKVRTENLQLHQKLTTLNTNIESLKVRIKKRAEELTKAQSTFSYKLSESGFSDENDFLKAILTTDETKRLLEQTKKLDDSQTDLKARKKDRETRLENALAKKITEKNLDELESLFEESTESLKQLRNDNAEIKHKLGENSAAVEKIKEKKKAVDMQKKEYSKWEKLHTLIGSADGKKYRNFAQGLTFELMVSHANRQLKKMSDRYLLLRDKKQPLELNVIDNYQAGEIRSTKNLSGGESFIVSLTLALGLSKMASRKVRVDSLFLDEGFGTLDEESLETALNTLSGLQQDGKLIGIISHISALKERISTQVTIKPLSGGRSMIEGPGCGKVG